MFRWTQKRPDGSRKFTDMSLGAYPAVSLVLARNKAQECREQLACGINPLEARNKAARMFGEVADDFIATMRSEWSNEKHVRQWVQTLEVYCASIRQTPVDAITTEHVLVVLNPIWHTKSETASRLRARIERVLDFATVKGWRSGDNPARWKGHLQNVLPTRKRVAKRHWPALSYADIPVFMVKLKERPAIAARALELTILTAARTSEVLLATWEEIDFDAGVWVVPAMRMKMRKEHKVPLVGRSLEVVQAMQTAATSDYIFPGQRKGRPLSNMSLSMLLRRMEYNDITVHGFRSTFRDWVGDKTDFPREVAEAALAHKVGNAVELAYRRSDALEKRRKLMAAWSEYCEADNGYSY